MIENGNEIDELRKLKAYRNDYKLDAWKSLFMATTQPN